MSSRKPLIRSERSRPRREKTATPQAQAKRRLRFEALEDRRLLAINLIYGGSGNPLELFDLDGSADNVSLSQPNPTTLKIDLHGATFGAISFATAVGLAYEVGGQPTSSTWATIDLSTAGAVPTLSLMTGDGDDRIQIVALASPNLGNLQIDGQGGNDTVTFYGEPSVTGYVNVDAESVVHLPVNHAPTDLTLSNLNIDALSGSGTAVGNLTTTDPDLNDSFTYVLVPGEGSLDNALFTVSGSQLRTSAAFASGNKSQYSLRLRSTDAGSLSCEKSVTLTVLANPWQNPVNPLDVDGLSGVTALDALVVINRVNTQGSGALPRPHPNPGSPLYLDVNGDGNVTPTDVLLVINYINQRSVASGEPPAGEASPAFEVADFRRMGLLTRPSPMFLMSGLQSSPHSPCADIGTRTVPSTILATLIDASILSPRTDAQTPATDVPVQAHTSTGLLASPSSGPSAPTIDPAEWEQLLDRLAQRL
ncbi:MAG: dockerin type I domain-containing protein [Planctomycetota bacterium]|nr:dockerin type I domain-containing protein [Planctomycetota bacterium]